MVGQESGGGIFQASKVMGIGGILHAASLRFFDFAISLSFSISPFYISLDPVDLVVSPLDRTKQWAYVAFSVFMSLVVFATCDLPVGQLLASQQLAS